MCQTTVLGLYRALNTHSESAYAVSSRECKQIRVMLDIVEVPDVDELSELNNEAPTLHRSPRYNSIMCSWFDVQLIIVNYVEQLT